MESAVIRGGVEKLSDQTAWVAHASRVLVAVSHCNELFLERPFLREVRDGGTPSPARETRALPRLAANYSLLSTFSRAA